MPLKPIHLTSFARARLTLTAAAQAIMDPYLRGDMVAALGETTGEEALQRIKRTMEQDPEGERILRDRPVLQFDDKYVDYLRKLGPTTVGGAFVAAMDCHDITIGTRTPVRYIVDPDLSYVMQRYRETHDILHILTGVPVSVSGEVGLKWFETKQIGLPMTALAAYAGLWRSESGEHGHTREYVTWCLRAADQMDPFLNLYYEEHWEDDLHTFRRNIKMPSYPAHLPRLDMLWDDSLDAQILVDHYQNAIENVQSQLSGSNDADMTSRVQVFQSAIGHINKTTLADSD